MFIILIIIIKIGKRFILILSGKSLIDRVKLLKLRYDFVHNLIFLHRQIFSQKKKTFFKNKILLPIYNRFKEKMIYKKVKKDLILNYLNPNLI